MSYFFPLRSTVFHALFCAAFVLMSVEARAQPSAPSFARDPGHAEWPARPAPSPRITAEQLATFAELVGEPRPVVWQRLQIDPGLVPFAAAAADERMSRKRSGKVRTIVGFSILGVGVAGGYILMLSGLTSCNSDSYGSSYGDSYGNSCSDQFESSILTGLLIMAASVGVGLGLGIPGIISMARQSEVETAAVERYQYPNVPMPPMPRYPTSSMPAPYTLKLPLLSLSF